MDQCALLSKCPSYVYILTGKYGLMKKNVTSTVLSSPYVMGSGYFCRLRMKLRKIKQKILIEMSTENFTKQLSDFKVENGGMEL